MLLEEELSYAAAGVDVEAYHRMLDRVRPLIEATHGAGVASGIGPFAGLFEVPEGRGHLAASTDSVGTKVKVAIAAGRHRGIGHDLVNHCVNDIATAGARPLFFLDYFASGKLDEAQFTEIVTGLAAACTEAGCALLGGETAEMPGVYGLGDYDLVGFAVGLVEPDRLPDRERVRVGDGLWALPSNGLHTNGFSLVRKVFDDVPLECVLAPLTRPLGEELLMPHRLYLKELRELWPRWKTAAHITGGGLVENLPRALPDGLAASVDRRAWKVPPIFRLISERGPVSETEMFNTFNMGLGMVLVAEEPLPGAIRIGEVAPRTGPERVLLV